MKENYEFKVGDVVERIRNGYNGMKVGDSGEITWRDNNGLEIKGYGRGHSTRTKVFKLLNPKSTTYEIY